MVTRDAQTAAATGRKWCTPISVPRATYNSCGTDGRGDVGPRPVLPQTSCCTCANTKVHVIPINIPYLYKHNDYKIIIIFKQLLLFPFYIITTSSILTKFIILLLLLLDIMILLLLLFGFHPFSRSPGTRAQQTGGDGPDQ